MYLNELVGRTEVPAIEVKGLAIDSRLVESGDLFIAHSGGVSDGHQFTDEAVSRGAIGVLSEREVTVPAHVANVVSPELVSSRNKLATKFYGNPSKDMTCIGTTGTNGKTSVTYGLASVLPSSCFLGSLGKGVLPNLSSTGLTTIDGVRLQRELANFKRRGTKFAAIEVSSHALDQGRVAEIQFDVGVFTNLTRDHLDYHRSMATYGQVKQKLFTEFDLQCAVINIDDEFGKHLAGECKNRALKTMTYGRTTYADVRWSDISFSSRGTSGTWSTHVGDAPLRLRAGSDIAIANAAAVMATLIHFGFDVEAAAHKLAKTGLPPGRLEFFKTKCSPQVIVDFAHSPDALDRVLRSLRKLRPNQLICVFGCGGDRDSGKRAEMGAAVAKHADRCVITNDNPRSEDPESIVQAIITGLPDQFPVEIQLDRREAIHSAIHQSTERDVILIAGKGAETHQEIEGSKYAFSDRQVVQQLLKEF